MPATSHPEWIGRYRILELIGEGGMGSVYLAEQNEPVRRRVALKIIKLGMDTRDVVARFDAERQALAVMDHPNVARVLDAGATEQGRPYFVMEYVPGVSITEYCDRARLSARRRGRWSWSTKPGARPTRRSSGASTPGPRQARQHQGTTGGDARRLSAAPAHR